MDSERRDDLQVTKVVLYQNGIGYFERRGTFDGQELKLRIRPDQINDMLTSLTVIDLNGTVGSISLPVEKNSSMVLGELPPQVRDAGGLLAVLNAFRGSQVDIKTKSGGASGRIVGVEYSTNADGGSSPVVTILTDDSELLPFELFDIVEVELGDRTLVVGLEKALDVALGEGEWKPVELVVHFPEDDDHDVIMSYVVAMPTWKPAYRLVFDKKNKVRLQGWAVIDNVSGESWDDIQLSLTAGAPISFVVDLHSPRLPQRADLTSRTYTANAEAPPEAVEAFNERSYADESVARAPSAKRRAGATSAPAPMPEEAWGGDYDGKYDTLGGSGYGRAEGMTGEMMRDSMVANATGEQMGALFRYDVSVPVTVPDRSSALVAIINDDVDAEDIFLFDPSSGSARAATHPYRAVRMNNTTKFVIEKGPLTIYKDSTFVGEGMTNQIGLEQTVFIPYSLEPSIHVEQVYDWGQQEQKLLKIKDGIITVESYQLQKVNFTITNNQEESIPLYLRVDKVNGFDIDQPERAIAQGEVYFVKVDVVPNDITKESVVQRSRTTQTMTLLDSSTQSIFELYLSDTSADPSVKAQLEQVLAKKKEVGDNEFRRATLAERQNELRYRAQDLRNNIKVLGTAKANESLKDSLVKKLMGVEDELAKIDGELVELGERKYAIEVEMRELFEGITLMPAK